MALMAMVRRETDCSGRLQRITRGRRRSAFASPHKWEFPAGTTIPANRYLLVWADEDGSDSPGLHA